MSDVHNTINNPGYILSQQGSIGTSGLGDNTTLNVSYSPIITPEQKEKAKELHALNGVEVEVTYAIRGLRRAASAGEWDRLPALRANLKQLIKDRDWRLAKYRRSTSI